MTTPSSLLPSQAVVALRKSTIPTLRKLRIEESDKVVVIAGQVPSYYFKQLAQEAVMPVLGPRKLLNHVSVVCGSES